MSTSELEVRPFVPGSLTGPRERDVSDELGRERARDGGRQSGFVSGYATGYSEGLRRAAESVAAQEAARDASAARELDRLRAQAGAVLLALRAAVVQVQEDGEVEAAAMAEVVARCAAELAEQVVLAAAPDAGTLLARIRRGLDGTPVGTVVAVRVHPEGLRALERAGVVQDGMPGGVTLVADPRLSAGDVVVRTGAATVTDLLRPAVAAAAASFTSSAPPAGPASSSAPAGVVRR
jgi:flagellar biosynthesis/type III secretory pathway protein FliH